MINDLAIPEDLIACVAPNVLLSNAFFLSPNSKKNPRNKQHAPCKYPRSVSPPLNRPLISSTGQVPGRGSADQPQPWYHSPSFVALLSVVLSCLPPPHHLRPAASMKGSDISSNLFVCMPNSLRHPNAKQSKLINAPVYHPNSFTGGTNPSWQAGCHGQKPGSVLNS